MAEPVGDLKQGPEPGEGARRPAPGPYPRQPAPQAEADQGGIGDREAEGTRDAEGIGDEAGGRQHVVEPENIFLDGMERLGGDQQDEGGSAARPHAAMPSSRAQRRGGSAAGSKAGRPTGWVAVLGMRRSSAPSQRAVAAPIEMRGMDGTLRPLASQPETKA